MISSAIAGNVYTKSLHYDKHERTTLLIGYIVKDDALVAASLSGGVDSSVAASILKKRFVRVVGATHYIWQIGRAHV